MSEPVVVGDGYTRYEVASGFHSVVIERHSGREANTLGVGDNLSLPEAVELANRLLAAAKEMGWDGKLQPVRCEDGRYRWPRVNPTPKPKFDPFFPYPGDDRNLYICDNCHGVTNMYGSRHRTGFSADTAGYACPKYEKCANCGADDVASERHYELRTRRWHCEGPLADEMANWLASNPWVAREWADELARRGIRS